MGMIETIKMIMNKLNRYHQKRRIRRLVRQLPGDMQSSVMHDLLGVIDIPDRLEKVRRTKEVFRPYKEQLETPYEQKVSDCRQEYSEMLDKARSNVIVPNLPMPHLSVNHDVLEQKVKAKLTLQALEEEIMEVSQLPDSFLFFSVLGIVLSTVANYMILEDKFGRDWLGGNELLTAICNGLFSLLLDMFVAIGLTYLMNIMPKKTGNGFTKLIGIAGALLFIISVCIIVLARTEIGTSVITSVQDVGKVE
jgi:lipid-A-disaccharide synthase-like uncharacterized protein